MKEILHVKRGDGTSSEVAIGDVKGLLWDYIPRGSKVIFITDGNVHRHYKDIAGDNEAIVIGLGEENKNLSTMQEIYGKLLAAGADRKSFIVGFGGGIVTDIAGFAASTYMRGMRFGFMPTTLLAQVDASVGGKNGVNFEGLKNMVGTFNQPDFVLCDISMFKTLPEREFRSGLAEVIKAGLILDRGLFELFENHDYEDLRNHKGLLLEAVTRAVKVKKKIVDMDEREMGDRKKLNLGHTFGHAVEKCTREFVHGEAVAIGMRVAAEISVKLNLLKPEESDRINTVLDRMGLPADPGVSIPELLGALRNDKKKDGDSVSLILMDGIGECVIRKFTFEEIAKMF